MDERDEADQPAAGGDDVCDRGIAHSLAPVIVPNGSHSRGRGVRTGANCGETTLTRSPPKRRPLREPGRGRPPRGAPRAAARRPRARVHPRPRPRTGRSAVGPEPHTIASSAPARRDRAERLARARRQRQRRRLQIVDDQLARKRRRRAGARRAASQLPPSAPAQAGRPRGTRRRSKAETAAGAPAGRRAAAPARFCEPRPRAGAEPRARHAAGWARRRQARRRSAAAGAGPASGARRGASRSIAAASAEPPPIPAATGIRLVIVHPHRGRLPAGRAQGEPGRRRPGCGPLTPSHTTSSGADAVTSRSSNSDDESNSVTSSWRPSSRVGPRNRQRLILAGARSR